MSIINSPTIFVPNKYLSGFICTRTGAGTYDISAGSCMDSTDTESIESEATVSVDITVSGAGGLDTGVEASNTWYYLHVIYNPTTDVVAGLISASSGAPTLPSGFDVFRRVGVVRNDAS